MGRVLVGLILALALLLPPQTSLAISSQVDVSVTIINGATGNIRFTGDAFPGALVIILKNNGIIGTTIADSQSFFDKTITGLSPGITNFSLYAQDNDSHRTVTIGFSVNVIQGSTVTVSGILLSPIVVVPDSIKRPETLTESGLAKNNSTVTTFTHSDPIVKQATTNSAGQWLIKITDILHLGPHTVSGLVQDGGGGISEQTADQAFQVKISADLNIDKSVNLTDFSILMFSYSRNPPPNLAADINDSGNAPDLVDFSIMMFYWTG